MKTPLTLIRDQIELGVDQVQQLLHLAEASEPQNYEFASVDAESLVFEVMNYLERLANQQGIRLQAVVEPGLTLLRADRGALFTLLKNLLENAIQHSRAGGVVQLARNRTSSRCRTRPFDLPGDCNGAGWDLQARRGEPSMMFDLSITRLGTSQAS